MGKRRSSGHVHHNTLKTIRAVVLGKDGVGKSGMILLYCSKPPFNPCILVMFKFQRKNKNQNSLREMLKSTEVPCRSDQKFSHFTVIQNARTCMSSVVAKM